MWDSQVADHPGLLTSPRLVDLEDGQEKTEGLVAENLGKSYPQGTKAVLGIGLSADS